MTYDDTRPGFAVGAVLGECFDLVRANWLNYALISVFLIGAPNLLLQVIQMQAKTLGHGGYQLGFWGLFLGFLGLVTLSQAMILVGALASEGDERLALSAMVRGGLKIALPLFALLVVGGLGVTLAALLLLVPAFVLATVWSVAIPAYFTEDISIRGALARSAALTKGSRWAIFGVLLCFSGIYLALYAVVGLVIGLVLALSSDTWTLETAAAVARMVMTPLSAPYQTCLSVAIYNGLRRSKESATSKSLLDAFN